MSTPSSGSQQRIRNAMATHGAAPSLWLGVLALFLVPATLAQRQDPPKATPQRTSFAIGTETTAPGSIEAELGVLGPWGTYSLPASIKFTPPTRSGLFHRMEFSLSFNTTERTVTGADANYKFGKTLDIAVRRPVYAGRKFSFALAPRAEIFVRNGSGANIGGSAITVYSFGLNALSLTCTGVASTEPRETIAPWRVDIAYGYSRSIGRTGLASRFVVAAEAQNQVFGDNSARSSLLQSLSYSVRPNLVFDVGMEQHGLQAGDFRWVFRGGVTYNFGFLW